MKRKELRRELAKAREDLERYERLGMNGQDPYRTEQAAARATIAALEKVLDDH